VQTGPLVLWEGIRCAMGNENDLTNRLTLRAESFLLYLCQCLNPPCRFFSFAGKWWRSGSVCMNAD
jgi:hypothetical protein